ncbi:MAG: shikimate dehydrogenase [Bacteroidota bacterium]|nr:shikimate dehydrogenase [Bacteroidota bacterium]MDP4234366.1 shikimate dehydrogenase [Bacteroidota bacterium]MDP4243299.1 shikimate dehydrogenase [Bacteroidota bacterium]
MRPLKAALIGRSLTHSISPEVHSALFPYVCPPQLKYRYDGIDYSKIECADENEMLDIIRGGLLKGTHGYNVTFPYKDVASRLSGEVDPVARDIHSANTIVLIPGGAKVYSTDGLGFREALHKEQPSLAPSQYQLIVLGAGGAARAVIQAVYKMGWGEITACARSLDHARFAFGHYGNVKTSTIAELTPTPLWRLVVQATPVGQRSRESLLEDFDWRPGDIAVDLIYNPLRTRFLDTAASGGATIISGLGMLIEQAALSQYIWIKEKPANTTLLSVKHYRELYTELAKFVTPRWDDSAI